MRKLLWCCSAAGVLAAGAMFSATYHACHHPESVVGRCIMTVADTSIVVQPIANIATMVAKATRHVLGSPETASIPGSVEECVPDDPQPIAAEPKGEPAEVGIIAMAPQDRLENDVPPIVIHEEEPLPRAELGAEGVPSTIDMHGPTNNNGMFDNQTPASACPMVMPYCTDDDEEVVLKACMPYADAGEKKPADGSEESENGAFRAWLKLFEGAGEEPKPVGEELPAPVEDVTDEPKCQEDIHRHEHYSGCPHMTCPYSGKSYPSCEPATRPGKEEPSEEPMPKPNKHEKKHGKGKEKCPITEGVDTMEYRRSDGGLNEYGPGPL